MEKIQERLLTSIPSFQKLVFDVNIPNPTVKKIVRQASVVLSQILSDFNLGPDLVDIVSCLYDDTIHAHVDIRCPHRWYELKKDVSACVRHSQPVSDQMIIQKSKASLANILRNINELILDIKKLPPKQQQTQNEYATMIKSNIVNLTDEDITELLRVFSEGETIAEFNKKYSEIIPNNIKSIGDRRPRFNDIIRDLPQAPAKDKAIRDHIKLRFGITSDVRQTGGARRRRTYRRKTKSASHRN